MKPLALSSLLLTLACTGGDKNITTTNQAPEASITSHQDGAEILEGVTTLFTGSVSDTNNSLDELLVTWYADTEIICPEAAPEVDATTRCEATLSEGVESITLAPTPSKTVSTTPMKSSRSREPSRMQRTHQQT